MCELLDLICLLKKIILNKKTSGTDASKQMCELLLRFNLFVKGELFFKSEFLPAAFLPELYMRTDFFCSICAYGFFFYLSHGFLNIFWHWDRFFIFYFYFLFVFFIFYFLFFISTCRIASWTSSGTEIGREGRERGRAGGKGREGMRERERQSVRACAR